MQKRALKSHKKQLGAQNTFFVDFGWIFVNFGWIFDNLGWICGVILVRKKVQIKNECRPNGGIAFPKYIRYTIYAIHYTLYAIRDTL